MGDTNDEIEDHSEGLRERLWGSSSNTDSTYLPQVKPDCKPTLGQEFASIDDVQAFYNNYAKEAGFSTRINSSKKDKETNEIYRKEYVCSKEGSTSKGVRSETKRRRGISREGCTAKLAAIRSKTGKYIVTVFVEDHNHSLATPRKVHLLRSHRNVTDVQRVLYKQLTEANVPLHQQISIFELQAGGIENIGCIGKDLYNYESTMRKEMKGDDADLLFEHFTSEKEKNSAFYFEIMTSDEDHINRCFWADAISRRGYSYFGDVVVFDTTYNTNRYGMILAPFVGVNNHGQTIVFACALLGSETTDSFVWLFEQFKKAMPSGPPKMIITDQDPAMTKAIKQCLPNTFHRYCSWHILNKFSEKLNALIYRDYYRDFQKCIWESYNMEEFDSRWKEIITKSQLNENEWLQSMYEIRSKWVPIYLNHVFSAGMSSSQRVESCHAFFKRYVSKKDSLVEFVVRFNRALARQRHEELHADHIDINEKPVIKLPFAMEKQMSEIYTRKMFYKFQEEFWNSLLYTTELVNESSDCYMYKIKREEECGSRVREIVVEKNQNFASCSCKKFESEGIPCRHILSYLSKMKINSYLPDHYILKRWTQFVKRDKVIDEIGLEIIDFSNKSFLLRRSALFELASKVIDHAAHSEEASKILQDNLHQAL
ncbi:hypothetical protein EZV62_019475 [Acer yangbiense]|uniref:SWIM-type domain-containing protein n=1 Tax=Acer yangbiense TaxID=1000413 RepID=A0A5C7HBJ5_9ROSI|nr:hypothetical protein EZV62_019475 [Acer yangbiense]